MDDSTYRRSDAPSSSAGSTTPSQNAEWREAKSGKTFDLHSNRWPLTSKSNLDVEPIRMLIGSNLLVDGAIRTLAHRVETQAAAYCNSLTKVLIRFLEHSQKHLNGDEIPEVAVINFKEHCFKRDGHDGNGMEKLRPFIKLWHSLGYSGISDNLIYRLNSWRLTGYEQHVRVNKRDIDAGPLMPDEQASLAIGALNAFESGTISLTDYAVYRLFDLSGRRPEQFIQIKLKDLDDSRIEDASKNNSTRQLNLLHIPRIKGGRRWREHFRAIPLPNDTWNLLVILRSEILSRFSKNLQENEISLQSHDLESICSQIPLFPGWNRITRSLETAREYIENGQHSKALEKLRKDSDSDAWETDYQNIWLYLKNTIEAAKVSNRSGNKLSAFPTRFRYTLCFNLERQGCPPEVIAHNLDHDSLAALPSYSKNGADKAARLSKAVALSMKPIAALFQGTIVDGEWCAVGGNDPANTRLLIHDAQPGATCATKRCGISSIPRACYNGCKHFQPWVDGPHEAFLEELLEEREFNLTNLDPVAARSIIEATDTLILAVVTVIHMCEKMRQESASETKNMSASPRSRGKTK